MFKCSDCVRACAQMHGWYPGVSEENTSPATEFILPPWFSKLLYSLPVVRRQVDLSHLQPLTLTNALSNDSVY